MAQGITLGPLLYLGCGVDGTHGKCNPVQEDQSDEETGSESQMVTKPQKGTKQNKSQQNNTERLLSYPVRVRAFSATVPFLGRAVR